LTILLKSDLVSVRRSFHGGCESERTDVVFAVFRVAELVYQELDTVRRGTNEAEASKVAHLLPVLIVQAIGQVDLVV
jgi:hypothetical protein